MPKRTDIKKILIIGSGPIVIGQACEFDYSGTQACKALRTEGYEVVLVNSNPATIMTDPEIADRTYIEPLAKEYLEAIIAAERPDALLPTVGGQTGLNLAVELAEAGILEKYGVEAHRRVAATPSKSPKTACSSRTPAAASASKFPRPPSSTRFPKRSSSPTSSAIPWSSARPSRSAAPAARSPTTARNSPTPSRARSTPARSTRR